MNKVTKDIFEHYRVRTIAAFAMASGAGAILVVSYLVGIV